MARSKGNMRWIIWVALFSGVAPACSCSEDAPACERFPSAGAVFTGTVLWGNDDGSGKFVQRTLYRVRVLEAFRGLAAEEREVLIDPGSYTSCYTHYTVGETYLFYAGTMGNVVATSVMGGGGPQKVLPAGMEKLKIYGSAMCSGSKLSSRASEDVAWIRKALRGETKTRVYGVAYQHRDGFGEDPGDVPLEGAKVTLSAGGVTLAVESGPEGEFAFEDVAPGRYRLLAAREPWKPSYGWPVEVLAGGCVERPLRLESGGSVAGVVRGAGSGVRVELVRVLRDGTLAKGATLRTDTTSDGQFAFRSVPAGRFRIGVNVVSPMTPERPFGTSQYAEGLQLEPNGALAGLKFDLQGARPVRTLRVRVFWADGREVASGARAWAVPVERQEQFSMATDAKGGNVVTMRVMEEYSYRVFADWFSIGNGKMDQVKSPEVVLPAGKGDAVLDIRLKGVR